MPKVQAIFEDMLAGKPLAASDPVRHWCEQFREDDMFIVEHWSWGCDPALNCCVEAVSGAGGVRSNDKAGMPLFGDLTRKSAISRFSRTPWDLGNQRRADPPGAEYHP